MRGTNIIYPKISVRDIFSMENYFNKHFRQSIKELCIKHVDKKKNHRNLLLKIFILSQFVH